MTTKTGDQEQHLVSCELSHVSSSTVIDSWNLMKTEPMMTMPPNNFITRKY